MQDTLDSQVHANATEYSVKWPLHPFFERTWELFSHSKSAPAVFKVFMAVNLIVDVVLLSWVMIFDGRCSDVRVQGSFFGQLLFFGLFLVIFSMLIQ